MIRGSGSPWREAASLERRFPRRTRHNDRKNTRKTLMVVSMKRRVALVSVALFVTEALSLSQAALAQTAAASEADFVVGDIKVEGLQRVSEGTVYNYLPVNIGDHLTPQRVREAIRALYATNFFRDVQ